jgi:hypothetical protein
MGVDSHHVCEGRIQSGSAFKEKSDPDLHLSEKLHPDPHFSDADADPT